MGAIRKIGHIGPGIQYPPTLPNLPTLPNIPTLPNLPTLPAITARPTHLPPILAVDDVGLGGSGGTAEAPRTPNMEAGDLTRALTSPQTHRAVTTLNYPHLSTHFARSRFLSLHMIKSMSSRRSPPSGAFLPNRISVIGYTKGRNARKNSASVGPTAVYATNRSVLRGYVFYTYAICIALVSTRFAIFFTFWRNFEMREFVSISAEI